MSVLTNNMKQCLDRLDTATNWATTFWVTGGSAMTCARARYALNALFDLDLVEKEKINASNVMWKLTQVGKDVVFALHKEERTGSWLT
ncbi:hypothetical protein [Methylosinus sp. PW1]|uniref:hypothetical protein n=1 Tax=Methylosinus sp. PW1 TaxID=107636 RepID=UPI0018DEC71D|nr:hypothetical protein [Methylosinus sp. PW1]